MAQDELTAQDRAHLRAGAGIGGARTVHHRSESAGGLRDSRMPSACWARAGMCARARRMRKCWRCARRARSARRHGLCDARALQSHGPYAALRGRVDRGRRGTRGVLHASIRIRRSPARGIERLQQAGIAVSVGAFADEARELNVGYFSRFERGRPYVRLKLAMSLDARTAPADGSRAGSAARHRAPMCSPGAPAAPPCSRAPARCAPTIRGSTCDLNYGPWVRQPLRVRARYHADTVARREDVSAWRGAGICRAGGPAGPR